MDKQGVGDCPKTGHTSMLVTESDLNLPYFWGNNVMVLQYNSIVTKK